MPQNKTGVRKSKILLLPLKILYALVLAILTTVFISLAKNIKTQVIFILHPEEKLKLKREIETKEALRQIEERLSMLERLMWSMHKDPEYMHAKAGKADLEKLHKEVKR